MAKVNGGIVLHDSVLDLMIQIELHQSVETGHVKGCVLLEYFQNIVANFVVKLVVFN